MYQEAITTTAEPTGQHSRYVLITAEAPAITTVHGMIQNFDDDDVLGIIAIANDCTSEPVHVHQDEDDGTWVITQSSAAGAVLEEVRYDAAGNVEHHAVLMPGFDTDQVPQFMVGA